MPVTPNRRTAGQESITKTKTSTSGCPSFRFTGTTTTRRASARCGGVHSLSRLSRLFADAFRAPALQEGALCALDVLSASGLINYFGRMELPGQSTNDEEALEDGLKVKPILLQKGETKLALYGMGNIRDDRFVFELTNRRINLYRPAENPDDWFNIILVHQNRYGFASSRSQLARPARLSKLTAVPHLIAATRNQGPARPEQLGPGASVRRGGAPRRVGTRARLHLGSETDPGRG